MENPGTLYQGNLNNTIFALWADYYNDSIDQLVTITDVINFDSKTLGCFLQNFRTIGWYNMGGFDTDKAPRGLTLRYNSKFQYQ